MISLSVIFWMYLLLFGIIGGLRGWAKEILVLFSMVLALFLDAVIMQHVPGVKPALAAQTPLTQFSVRATFFLLLAFFGYETPAVATIFADKARRERLEDMLLGLFLGVINGYLLVGTLWHYLHATG
ncbi:MAG: CvpA family protein, partial [Anaerolineales bacterium]|nr:CvpA family protein [Anaerolineales bacterium]